MSTSHQRLNADRQIESVNFAVRQAIEAIRDDLRAFGHYPHNRGRISEAEILRRAGNVDKRTLRQAYHSELKRLIVGFVDAHRPARDQQPVSVVRRDGVEGGYDLGDLAQALVAAQILRDKALDYANKLERDLREKGGRLLPTDE